MKKIVFVVLGICLLSACNTKYNNVTDSINSDTICDSLVYDFSDLEVLNSNGDINVLIEIPAGTSKKWELNKTTGKMDIEIIDGEQREVKYLAYPANYGMIPNTLLPKDKGGDGDPLDVLVIGEALSQGCIVSCKPIGVLKLLDGGEQDDKIIAISSDSPLYYINDISQLDKEYSGITNIIELWFTNYKGQGIMQSEGFGDETEAINIINLSIEEFSCYE